MHLWRGAFLPIVTTPAVATLTDASCFKCGAGGGGVLQKGRGSCLGQRGRTELSPGPAGGPPNRALVLGPANPLPTLFPVLTPSVMFFLLPKSGKPNRGREDKGTRHFTP